MDTQPPQKPLTIGATARRTGVPERTIRYYESIGLVAPSRAANSYREFGEREQRRLQFVAKARSLGFSVDDCRALLALQDNPARASARVRALAQERVAQLDGKISVLRQMRRELASLVAQCQGDLQPDCPILDRLAGEGDEGAERGDV